MQAPPAEGTVVILVIGDEILSGRTRDANGNFLAERLDALGWRVRRIVVVPDEDAEIRRHVREALADASVALCCGGLGSTHDDRTTAAVAAELSRKLVLDEAGWAKLVARYEKRYGPIAGIDPEIVAAARKMVLVPEGARLLANPVGAATGYALDASPGTVVVAPGVPAELQTMFNAEIAGKVLPERARDAVLELDVLMPEARFAAALERVALAHPGVAVGSYPHWGELRVTLRFRGPLDAAAAAREAFGALYPAEVTARRGDQPP